MTDLTPRQREARLNQARTAIADAVYNTYGQHDIDRSHRIADTALDALGDLAAEILTDGTLLKSLNIENGVVHLDLEPAREILLTLVAAMRGMLEGYGAENYLETEITAPSQSVSLDVQDGQNPLDSYTVTIQRRTRPTPHEFRQQAEAKRDKLASTLDEVLNAFERYWARASYDGPVSDAVRPEQFAAWRRAIRPMTEAEADRVLDERLNALKEKP